MSDDEDDDTCLSRVGLSQISALDAMQLTYRKYCDPLVGDWMCFGQEHFLLCCFFLDLGMKAGIRICTCTVQCTYSTHRTVHVLYM